MESVLEEIEKSPGNKLLCKGRIYKAEISNYETKKGFAQTVKLNLMKRFSCSGCEMCGWIDGCINMAPEIEFDFTQFRNGKYYKIDCVITSRDYETGLADDWEWVFREVKREDL